MAVKCNTPNLAFQALGSLLYGFSCNDVNLKLAETYLEYLNCPTVNHVYCYDADCPDIEEEVTCTVVGIEIDVEDITETSAEATFDIPAHTYQILLIANDVVINTRNNPASPILYTGLIEGTTYTVRMVISCPYGESRTVNHSFTTLVTCVNITDFVASASLE